MQFQNISHYINSHVYQQTFSVNIELNYIYSGVCYNEQCYNEQTLQ